MNLIETIKTHLHKFTMLYVSLIRPQYNIAFDENEKNIYFTKNNTYDKNYRIPNTNIIKQFQAILHEKLKDGYKVLLTSKTFKV